MFKNMDIKYQSINKSDISKNGYQTLLFLSRGHLESESFKNSEGLMLADFSQFDVLLDGNRTGRVACTAISAYCIATKSHISPQNWNSQILNGIIVGGTELYYRCPGIHPGNLDFVDAWDVPKSLQIFGGTNTFRRFKPKQGAFRTGTDGHLDCSELRDLLHRIKTNQCGGVFTCGRLSVALFGYEEKIACFDSHRRDNRGNYIFENGKACFMWSTDVEYILCKITNMLRFVLVDQLAFNFVEYEVFQCEPDQLPEEIRTKLNIGDMVNERFSADGAPAHHSHLTRYVGALIME